MDTIKISTAQFENKSGDKEFNLSRIENLSEKAACEGSQAIAFHECSITGYSHARHLSIEEMLSLAEFLPSSPSVARLTEIAAKNCIVILAGLFEKDKENNLYNTYVCVDNKGLIAKHRKLHPFINPYLKSGNEYCVFDMFGWRCGVLTCYDNNIMENVRATTLLGANIIFMPHVTMCTPSTRPGAGFVDPKLWEHRETNQLSLRKEFDGIKGREWLMKWLPSRAYDNGIYVVFSNPIGMDDDQLKNGCSMILDPFGDVVNECRSLGDDFVSAILSKDKLGLAGGTRYIKARRPELYREIIGQAHIPEQKVIWIDMGDESNIR